MISLRQTPISPCVFTKSAWTDAAEEDHPKALWAATQIIDTLNYKGFKHPVYALLQSYGLKDLPVAIGIYKSPTFEEIMAAEGSQELEFPRARTPKSPRRSVAPATRSLTRSSMGKTLSWSLRTLALSAKVMRQSARRSAAPTFQSSTSSMVCLPRWHGDCCYRSCATMTRFA